MFPDKIECFDLEQKKTLGQLSVREIERFVKQEVWSGSVEEDGDGDIDVRTVHRTVLLSCSDKDMADLDNELIWQGYGALYGFF